MFQIKNAVGVIKLMKGKALRKHSLHEKTAASVLLKTEERVALRKQGLNEAYYQ